MSECTFILPEQELPKFWYNVIPGLPVSLPPPLNPVTGQPASPSDSTAILPLGLIEQEMATSPTVSTPEPVLDILRLWRPTPLYRARRREKMLGTPAKIFYKHEGVSPAGSHKPNTSVAQAYFNKVAGIKRLCTETGAGQWGSALALTCNVFGMGGRGASRRHQLLFGERAQPRAAPSDDHRPGSHCPDETRQGLSGHRDRLLRRWGQFCGHCLSVHSA
jgi:tryptophan synthase beta chain